MRAIEKVMIQAINAKKNLHKDTTSVIYYPDTNTSDIFLNGCHIGTFCIFPALSGLMLKRSNGGRQRQLRAVYAL